MAGYSYKFVSNSEDRDGWYCPLCHLPMCHPVQIKSCGHKFCDSCLQNHLSDGELICPEDKQLLDYALIFPDLKLKREIMQSSIHCHNQSRGCRWMSRVHTAQSHHDSCKYQPLACSNGCPAILFRQNLENHIEDSCPRRMLTCEFCDIEFFADKFETGHEGNCPQEVMWCENKCGAKLQRKYLDNHMQNECHKRLVTCRYCKREFVEETLQTHQYQCPRFPVTCPNRCEPAKIPREEVTDHVQEACPSSLVPCPYREAGCSFKGPRYALDKHIEDSSKTHLQLMWSLVQRQRGQIDQLSTALENSTYVTNGTFVWRITDYKSKMLDAIAQKKCEHFSQPFYSSRYGYKMVLSIFPNGNMSAVGKYLSVYIKLLPGEYDNILHWPFVLPVSVTLYDQTTDPDKRANITDSFIPDPTWKHFQKPSKDFDGFGFGYPKYVSLEVVKSRNYLKDDCVIIKVTVDSSKIITS